MVWKYPRNKDTYELLINEFENDVEKVSITPPRKPQECESERLIKQNKRISELEHQVKSLKSNIELIEDQRDQYLSRIIQLASEVEFLKEEYEYCAASLKGLASKYWSTVDSIVTGIF